MESRAFSERRQKFKTRQKNGGKSLYDRILFVSSKRSEAVLYPRGVFLFWVSLSSKDLLLATRDAQLIPTRRHSSDYLRLPDLVYARVPQGGTACALHGSASDETPELPVQRPNARHLGAGSFRCSESGQGCWYRGTKS
jgi:hypothetical protein